MAAHGPARTRRVIAGLTFLLTATVAVTATPAWAGPGSSTDDTSVVDPIPPGITDKPIPVPVDTTKLPSPTTLIIRCKFSDHLDGRPGEPAEPTPPGGWGRFFTSQGVEQQAVYDYLNQQMQGTQHYDADITPWYEMSATEAQFVAMRAANPATGRRANLRTCAAMADPDYYFPQYHNVVVVLNAPSAADGSRGGDFTGGYPFPLTFDGVAKNYGGTIIGSSGFDMNGVLQEMLHAYPVGGASMRHGSNAYRPGDLNRPEYGDPWDVMSAYANFEQDGFWGPQGAHLSGARRELAGFMPEHQRLDYGVDETCLCYRPVAVTLEPLAATGTGRKLLKIPVGDDTRHYYTVEYRTRTGFDWVLPADGVLIYEVRPDNTAYLMTRTPIRGAENDAQHAAGDQWTAPLQAGQQITVSVQSLTPEAATVN
ncbi:hypothetical protein ACVBEQ_04720 [Nakamurella sp. GG22]